MRIAVVLFAAVVGCGAAATSSSGSGVDSGAVVEGGAPDAADASLPEEVVDASICDNPPEESTHVASDNCGILGMCAACVGGVAYRCQGGGAVGQPRTRIWSSDPDAGDEKTVDVRLGGCKTISVNEATGESLYCCAPSCVRFAGGDGNCSATNGKWYLCPAGTDHMSSVGSPPGNCAFNGQTGAAAGYCCD